LQSASLQLGDDPFEVRLRDIYEVSSLTQFAGRFRYINVMMLSCLSIVITIALAIELNNN